jgi:2-C-methyl-D-erythritol 2,4-cyclodiphosphate synthase
MRVGQGYDVHPFDNAKTLVLGGVCFEGEPGLAGHSDGDALTHAIIDALLGAAALGDIGSHFPSSDDKYKGADSLDLLKRVCRLIAAKGCRIANVDTIVVAEQPRMAPRVAEMQARLAFAMGLELTQVSVKATTTDGLGAIGRGEGIAAQAVALVEEA